MEQEEVQHQRQHRQVQHKQHVFPKATTAAIGPMQQTVSEPTAVSAPAQAGPSLFKFGLNTAERKTFSCNGGAGAAAVSNDGHGQFTAPQILAKGGMVRFGGGSNSEPPGAFDFVLGGVSFDDSTVDEGQQQAQSGSQATTTLGSVSAQPTAVRSTASTSEDTTASASTADSGASSGSEASELYENDFEEYEHRNSDEGSCKMLQQEIEQRQRIMQTIAELSG